MTKDEAMLLLDNAPVSDKPSRLNPSLTEAQAVDIIRNGLVGRALEADGVTLVAPFEKRVHQVTRNQKRPQY